MRVAGIGTRIKWQSVRDNMEVEKSERKRDNSREKNSTTVVHCHSLVAQYEPGSSLCDAALQLGNHRLT